MGSRILSGTDLPTRLLDLPRPPAKVYVRGELPRGPAVAIVGTRYPTLPGSAFARELARALAERGVAILSGGAKGVDTEAHEGALLANGITVVVAPAGFLKPFPARNRGLFERIVDSGGAYLSLAADEVAATQGSFFRRNACLAALAHALVVVEAPFRSGARNAARFARALGRPFLAVPHAPWERHGEGCLLELRLGARLCTGAADVLAELERCLTGGLMPQAAARTPIQVSLPFSERPLTTDAIVLDAVRRGARNADEICELSGLGPALVQRHVLTLTLEGELAPDPAGGLRVTPDRGLVSAPNQLK